MKYLPYLISLFRTVMPAEDEEVALHIGRLNELLLAYQQVKTMTAAEWQATEREIEMELQWFDIHHLKLTRISYPVRLASVQTASATGLKRRLTQSM
jgi:hypothetical protein